MRILILGNNYSAKSFYNFFTKNKENIVFSTIRGYQGFIDFVDDSDIVDFCEANDINFVLIIDEQYINSGLQEQISSLEISAFSPTSEAIGICASKACAKRFMYKNKIKTPKFQIIEKPQMAFDYVKSSTYPKAIKPDNSSYQEGVKFFETYSQAQNLINDYFRSGNKKILIEDYIEGKNFTVWTLSDGYSAKIISICAKYQNEVALFNPSFVDENLINEIQNNFINPTLKALNVQEEEYIGILGFNFILTPNKELFLINYNSFFDDICVDFHTKGFEIDWLDVFESTLVGDIFTKHDFKNHKNFMLTLRQKDKIKLISANTKTGLNIYLEELDYDLSYYKEAQKIWKY